MMYKTAGLFLAMALPLLSLAQGTETEVETTVKEVTVFRSGVEEYREGKTSVPSGNSILKLSGLPNTINPNSIQVKGVENFTILSIQYRINYMAGQKATPEVQQLIDSIDILSNQISYTQKKVTTANQEKQLFIDNKNMVGKDTGLDPDELEEMLLLYGKKLSEISTELADLYVIESKYRMRQSLLQSQLNTHYSTTKTAGEILVNVSSKTKITSTQLVVSYYATSGGWSPFYDVRAKDTKSEIEIDYKANVFQTTGTDWDNVKMILSSSSPNFSNTLPELANWYLQYGNYYNNGNGRNNYENSVVTGWDYNQPYSGGYAVTTSTQQATSTEFAINKPYSIPTDGKTYVVEIGKHKVPATYQYYAVPKMEESAFILARLTGWYDLNLLQGKTNIYFGNSYVGEAWLNPEVVEDTLDISLGNDESIVIKRENVSDMNAKTVTGNTKKKTEEFEISVRNNRGHDVKIKILDQIPVSSDKEVVVTADSYEGANYKKENGELSWLLDVKSGETSKVRLKYTVKYPKNKIISNL